MLKCIWIVVFAGLLGACAGDGTLDEIDPAAAPANPTYQEHVSAIMDLRCTACHAVDAQPGEVEGYGYDTCEKVKNGWASIVETSIDAATMPPAGADRMTSAEILTLERWYEQGAQCP